MWTRWSAYLMVCCHWSAGVRGLLQKRPKSGGCEPTFEHLDCFSVYLMYTLIDSDNKDLGLLYGSFIEMPGKRASPEKRSYYFGTEGVVC
jgi:hypothetical protein